MPSLATGAEELHATIVENSPNAMATRAILEAFALNQADAAPPKMLLLSLREELRVVEKAPFCSPIRVVTNRTTSSVVPLRSTEEDQLVVAR